MNAARGEPRRQSPGRHLQAMVLRRLYYDMKRYDLIKEYVKAKRLVYIDVARSSKRRLEKGVAEMVDEGERHLEQSVQKSLEDLERLRQEIRVEDSEPQRSLQKPFSESPDFLKTFDIF